jgi:glycosyltransferase involved in cell wall biosynthesis
MRILCFLHSFEPGGVERTALRLCAQWQDNGLDVTVMLGRATGRMREDAPGLDYREAPQPGFSVAWIETLWMILWLPGIVRRMRPDILFCAGNSYTIVAVALKLLLGRRCPPIVAKISNDLSRPDLPGPIRFLYHLWCLLQGRVIDHWVALSPAMAAEAAIFLGVPSERLSTIANPILDAARCEALAVAGERSRASRQPGRRFLAAGRLAPQKGFDRLIAAFAQGAQPLDRLVIVGDGPLRARLRRQIATLGLEDRVLMPGHCRAIETYLARSDIFVLPSLYEGLPAVVVEAMAAGIAVIATDCCASMRGLFEGGTDILMRPDELGSLSLAIALAAPRAGSERAAPVAAFQVVPGAQAYQHLFAGLLATDRTIIDPHIVGEPA